MEKLTFDKFMYIVAIIVIPTLFFILHSTWKEENTYLKTKLESKEKSESECSANLNQIITLQAIQKTINE